MVNFKNYLYSIYEALFKSADVAALISPDIVKTIYVDPVPAATWKQIIGAVARLLGILGASLGPLGEAGAATAAALGVVSGLSSESSAGVTLDQIVTLSVTSFTEYASIGDYIGTYVQKTTSAIANCYDSTIGPHTDIFEWAGTPDLASDMRYGLLGDGLFSPVVISLSL